jgi:hypothetical protein
MFHLLVPVAHAKEGAKEALCLHSFAFFPALVVHKFFYGEIVFFPGGNIIRIIIISVE